MQAVNVFADGEYLSTMAEIPIMKGSPWGNSNIQCCEEGNTNALCINHISAAYTCHYLKCVVLFSF